MRAIVNSVQPDSIAFELDIQPGDEVLFIDEKQPIDLIDYQRMIEPEEISLHIRRGSGEEEIIDIEKDPEEDLGIIFESAVFDRIIPCNNRCVFCFVDQQPDFMRESLHVKDDDYRLSYLQGTYVTLTNLRPEHRKRIEELNLAPLYVSVHTTNPELRCKMLQNPKAGGIMDELKWLDGINIPVHAQIVLCPGMNTGEEFERTLKDLGEGLSNILSIAVVPVGITRYREEGALQPFTAETALQVIDQVAEFNKRIGKELAVPSDEFYIKAGRQIPEDKFYGEYGQIEDGVGAARLLLDDYELCKDDLPAELSKPFSFTIATGQLACEVMQPIVEDLNKIENLKVELIPVESRFWGDKVTVSGLVTGQDLLDAVLPVKEGMTDLVIPSVMLRQLTEQFLDDMTLEDVRGKLGVNIHVIDDYYSFEELLDLILDNE